MAHLLDEIPRRPEFSYVKLASQVYATAFYTAMGFEVIGDAFEDGGLPHHDMILKLRARSNGGK
jgi:predicted GNAT family N-acyltransferase